jgi:hypothetical protein
MKNEKHDVVEIDQAVMNTRKSALGAVLFEFKFGRWSFIRSSVYGLHQASFVANTIRTSLGSRAVVSRLDRKR